MSSAESNLSEMLAVLDVSREPGVFVFVTVADAGVAASLPSHARIRERAGHTLVMRRDDAIDHGLFYDFEAAWLTLDVHSALSSIGLTAAVSTALAGAGIPCNVLAGYHHDHLLVPELEAEHALGVVRALRCRA